MFYLLIQLGLFSNSISLPGMSSKKGLESGFSDFSQATDSKLLEFAHVLDNQQTDVCMLRNKWMEKQSSLLAIERNKNVHVHQDYNEHFPTSLAAYDTISQLAMRPESYTNHFPGKRLKISMQNRPEVWGGSNLAQEEVIHKFQMPLNQVDGFHGK
jgi:hypothetical protein